MLQKYWPLLLLVGVGLLALFLVGGGEKSRPRELKTEDVKQGDGAEAKDGDRVRVHYTGRLLATGVKFDSSLDRGDPFTFTLGRGQVIKGWDEGVVGMKVGGKRKLTIPANLGYGSRGHPPKIPPDSDLEFDVELLEIVQPAQVKIEDTQVGEGAEAKSGSRVRVHYTGRLVKGGTKFDSSHDRNKPFEFTLGRGQVIRGWDEGVLGMKVGGKRKLIVPADLGYGDAGSPPTIPPNADLEFDIELLEIIN